MTHVALGLLFGLVLAFGNLFASMALLGHPLAAEHTQVAIAANPTEFAWLLGMPMVFTVAIAFAAARVVRWERGGATVSTPSEPVPPPEPVENGALRLLTALQEEGRLVDFLTEDIAAYSDDQVGAATRGIHETCAKALRECVSLEPVMPGEEEADVVVPPGFDPAAIRLTGNVQGEPPFKGTLRHAGWRATGVVLPARRGIDPHVIVPAEVEIA
jgi:Domain of unknown function (DUF2760)